MNLKLKKIKAPDTGKAMPVDSSSMAPSFYVDDEQMPEISNWEVGEKYRLVIEIEQKSKNENEHRTDGRFEIVGYKYLPEKTYDEMTDAEFQKVQNKARDGN